MSGGFKPEYLEKLSESQRNFLKRAVGVKFTKEFVFKKGNHLFICGNTGSGKTQKGYWIVDFLKHTENQIWISTAKSKEILPLLCQGKNVRIIIPTGAEFSIEEHTFEGWKDLNNPPEIVEVRSASEAWDAIHSPEYDQSRHKKNNWINIFEFRDTITEKDHIRSQWMIALFESLALRTRSGTMPPIFPCTIYLDEAQWLLAGGRITKDGARIRNSSIVIENVLEMRSAGCRFVLFAQSYKNIPPAIRENMLNTILCRGAKVESEENEALAYHCRLRPGPTRYAPYQGKFVHADGTAYPMITPWEFPLYPLSEEDRKWIGRIRLNYGKKHGEYTRQEEIETECLPELGRFSAMAIPPEEQGDIINRWQSEGVIPDD
jgi:energy-coupling factor transporter ATP-binding protein EcfA2